MIRELQTLYDLLDTMDKATMIVSFREMIEAYSETLSAAAERERAETDMSIQFQSMKEKLVDAEAVIETLKNQNLALTTELQKLKENLQLRNRNLFGRSSEKGCTGEENNASGDFAEDPLAEGTPDTTGNNSTTDKEQTPKPAKTARKPHGVKKQGIKEKNLAKLPKKTEFLLDVAALNKTYGEGNWRIRKWERHEEYACVPCTKYLKVTYTPILSTGLEHELHREHYKDQLLKHSMASASIVADIMYNKFVLGLPLYRQETDLQRNGIYLSRQTMTNWILKFSTDLFGPVYDYLGYQLRLSKYNQCDETVMEVIQDGRKAGSKSYMWVHTTSELAEGNPIAVFCYEMTRNTDHLRQFYSQNGYNGFLTSDAYISYDVIEKESNGQIKGCGCFMHSRRRFVYAMLVQNTSKLSRSEVEALPEFKALQLIDQIYAEDTLLKSLSPEERLQKCGQQVRPKVDGFFDYIHSLNPDDPSYSEKLKDAIRYSVNQEAKLRMFLEDASIPADNGNAERSIRPFTVGRNNWLFCYSITGAEAMAIIYTLVETAKANQVHPYYYLMYLLEKMPLHMDDTNREFLKDMVPWSQEYLNYETLKKKETFQFLL